MEKKKVRAGTAISIIVVLLIIIGGLCGYIYTNRNNNNETQANSNEINTVGDITEQGQEIDFNSAEVQKIMPFTGAFPSTEYRYLYKLGDINASNITNEFILRMAFSKVTKEDWADSYKGEDQPVSIGANVLDQYVKDIFGNVSYTKTEFSNKDLEVNINGQGQANIYDSKLDGDRIVINWLLGADVDSDIIEMASKKAVKYSDRIEITLNPIILKFENQSEDDGNMIYTTYSRYNYDNQECEGEVKANVSESDALSNIDISKLDTIKLIYKLDNNTGNYYFSEMTKTLSSNK